MHIDLLLIASDHDAWLGLAGSTVPHMCGSRLPGLACACRAVRGVPAEQPGMCSVSRLAQQTGCASCSLGVLWSMWRPYHPWLRLPSDSTSIRKWHAAFGALRGAPHSSSGWKCRARRHAPLERITAGGQCCCWLPRQSSSQGKAAGTSAVASFPSLGSSHPHIVCRLPPHAPAAMPAR